MPIIKVWCLPAYTGESSLQNLHKKIVDAVCSIKELNFQDEKDMTVLFPRDMMSYGLGTEIIVEVTGLFIKPERTQEVRQRFAESLGQTVSKLYPKAKVECMIYSFDRANSFWSSEEINHEDLDNGMI